MLSGGKFLQRIYDLRDERDLKEQKSPKADLF